MHCRVPTCTQYNLEIEIVCMCTASYNIHPAHGIAECWINTYRPKGTMGGGENQNLYFARTQFDEKKKEKQ